MTSALFFCIKWHKREEVQHNGKKKKKNWFNSLLINIWQSRFTCAALLSNHLNSSLPSGQISCMARESSHQMTSKQEEKRQWLFGIFCINVISVNPMFNFFFLLNCTMFVQRYKFSFANNIAHILSGWCFFGSVGKDLNMSHTFLPAMVLWEVFSSQMATDWD